MAIIGAKRKFASKLVIPFIAGLLLSVLIGGPVTRAADAITAGCPLRTGRYTAQPGQAHLTGGIGAPVMLAFTLDPPTPPPGFFLTVNLKPLAAPAAAETAPPHILTGFPETKALFFAAGTYRYEAVVSLIAKSSCGGVKAETLFKGEVQMSIRQSSLPRE